jgi:S-formylglutathione hydrolase FrmB
MSLEITGASKSFGGWTKHYTHRSTTLNCDMRFAIYQPPQTANGQKVPVVYWLSGLTNCRSQKVAVRDKPTVRCDHPNVRFAKKRNFSTRGC